MDQKNDIRKYIERHKRRHGIRPAGDRALWQAQRFLRRTLNIREGRASYNTIRRRFVNGARLTGTHLCILVAAMLVACIGLDTDSDIAIIGAMLICPLMGSVLAIAYGLATLDRAVMRDALSGLVLQMAFCLATSAVYFSLSPIAEFTNALIENSNPTAWDLLVALIGGFAGALGNSRDQEPATLISGVAVATALMPPLCAAGFGISSNDAMIFFGALYEFGVNVVFIALSADMVLLLLRVPLKRDLNGDGIVTEEEEKEVQMMSRTIRHRLLLGTVIFAIPCLFFTADMVKEASEDTIVAADQYNTAQTAQELEVVCPELVEYSVGSETSATGSEDDVKRELIARVTTTTDLDASDRHMIENLIRLDVPELDRVEFEVA